MPTESVQQSRLRRAATYAGAVLLVVGFGMTLTEEIPVGPIVLALGVGLLVLAGASRDERGRWTFRDPFDFDGDGGDGGDGGGGDGGGGGGGGGD